MPLLLFLSVQSAFFDKLVKGCASIYASGVFLEYAYFLCRDVFEYVGSGFLYAIVSGDSANVNLLAVVKPVGDFRIVVKAFECTVFLLVLVATLEKYPCPCLVVSQHDGELVRKSCTLGVLYAVNGPLSAGRYE